MNLAASLLLACITLQADKPLLQGELIFPPEHLHNHASCVVECPNGDLLVCWYNGSGERNADDVKVEGARLHKGSRQWSNRFLLADTPGFPDTNPCLFIDPQQRLWLIWQAILANEWHTALPKYKIASSYQDDGPPKWEAADNILFKQTPEFAEIVSKQTKEMLAQLESAPAEGRDRFKRYIGLMEERAKDKYFSRLGWMTRAHPIVSGKRLIIPLYSDGYSFSLMALSDDGGATWQASQPIVGAGNIQPALARKKDGTLVAYMRDNGPPPKRLHVSESRDNGSTWSPVRDSNLPNPGAGTEVINLANGRWLLIYNDTERGRHSLAVSLSDDEGKTWKWTRHLERDEMGPNAGSYHYPSVIQARDGSLHATYTYTLNGDKVQKDDQGRRLRECIKHVHFNEAWIEAGDTATPKTTP